MIKFRTATIEDTLPLSILVNSAYRGDYSQKGWTTEADYLDGQRTDPESLREIIETPLNQIEIAFDENNQILGSVHLRLELPDTLYFGMLTVEPSLQASGLGKVMLEQVEQIAKDQNLQKIRMTVIHLRSKLISYYERRGFMATGNYEPFPEHDPRFGIPRISGLKLQEFIREL